MIRRTSWGKKLRSNVFPIFAILVFIILNLLFSPPVYTGKLHADKYGTNIPPISHILETEDYFSNVNSSRISLLSDDRDGYIVEYSTFPFYNLTVVPLSKIFPSLPLLSVVLIVCMFQATLIILLWFQILEKLVSKKIAKIFTLLLVFNPLFHLFAVLTTDDLPAFLLFSLGVWLLSRGSNNKAYSMFGFSMLMKISFAPIVLGFSLPWIFFNSKEKWKINTFNLLVNLALPYLGFTLFIQDLPSVSNQVEILLRIIVFIAVNVVGQLILGRRKFIEMVEKYYLPIMVLGFIVALPIVLQQAVPLFNLFLTEPRVLFSAELYAGIAGHLLESIPLILLVLVFVALLHWNKLKSPFTVSLYVSAITYFLLGSKSIYFHYYYKHIFMVILLIWISFGLVNVLEYLTVNQQKIVKLAFLTVTLLFFLTQSNNFINRTNAEEDFRAAAQYLSSNLEEDEIVIRSDAQSKNLVIFEPIPIINYVSLSDLTLQTVRPDIEKLGLSSALDSYGVKYLVTASGEEDFSNFNYLFDENIPAPSNRTERIVDQEQIDEVGDLFKAEDNFYLEKSFGLFNVYRLWN